jgi:glycerol-3-phosphate cytidylyltransferase-like family protein
MRSPAPLAFLLLPAALVAQAPAPSLGDRVKAERPAIEQLWAELKYPEAMKRAEALLPPAKPAFDKTDNKTLVQSCGDYLDLAEANRLATETADSAGAWEKALEYAKAAKALALESYAGIKEPFEKTVVYYTQLGVRAKQVLDENDARIKELKGKTVLDPGERQELDLALSVEKEVVDDAKWVKFFQTYLDVAKRESVAYDPIVKVMEDKLKGEADQVAEYKAGKGEKTKWVEAVISSQAYLEAQGDRAGKARWLYRLATLDPENKKVQRQLDILMGRVPAPPAKPSKKGK